MTRGRLNISDGRRVARHSICEMLKSVNNVNVFFLKIHVRRESKKFRPEGFLAIFSSTTEIFKIKFYTLVVRSYLRKMAKNHLIISNLDNVVPY